MKKRLAAMAMMVFPLAAFAVDERVVTLAEADCTVIPAVTCDKASNYILMVNTSAETVSVVWYRGNMVDEVFVPKLRESEQLRNVYDEEGNAVVGQQYYTDAMTALDLSDKAVDYNNIHALLGDLIKAKRIMAKSVEAEVVK